MPVRTRGFGSPAGITWLASAVFIQALAGCAASIPKGSYGVSSVEIRGAEPLDEAAIKACLATHEREKFEIVLGSEPSPSCGVPPFDATRLPIEFWAWPWTDWPLFNETAFERDQERIERWFRARGYYDARVEGVTLLRDEEARELELTLRVRKGEPVLIVRITLDGIDELDPELQQQLREAIELERGAPFDEAFYDRTKRALVDVLQEASYARAAVLGSADIDPAQRLARVGFTVVPGPPSRFGQVSVVGNAELPERPIRAAAGIEPGSPFSLSALRDARYAIFALGPFASVDIDHRPRPGSSAVDVIIRVAPARMVRFGVGVGISSGGLYALEATDTSVDTTFQWDLHLLGKFEHRNFLGGMRNLRIEDRPRLIFNDPFPDASRSDLGNLLTMQLRQPAFIEARTALVARARWDLGPDPYGGRFLRHDVAVGLGPERLFFEGKLRLSSTINTELFLPKEELKPYPEFQVTYLHYLAQLDLRDDPRRTRRGSYFAVGLQHAGYFLPSDWDYVRITQDSRGYVPLPGGLVLAGRLRLGWMQITDTTISVPEAGASTDEEAVTRRRFLQDLAQVGPLRHRLRGGGQHSVRGYAPNMLGDVISIDDRLISGGLRQWEASIELRVPITESFGAVLFTDAGDVSRPHCDENADDCDADFRFDVPQTSFGLGLRYHTIVGPLRFDAAIAPEALQHFGQDERIRENVKESELFGIDGVRGAVSFTIGESF